MKNLEIKHYILSPELIKKHSDMSNILDSILKERNIDPLTIDSEHFDLLYTECEDILNQIPIIP